MRTHAPAVLAIALSFVAAVSVAAVLACTARAADEEPPEAVVQRDLLTLRRAIALHALGVGELPASLAALTLRTEALAPALVDIPTDPWGRAYVYEKLDVRRFRLVSLGPDGKAGSADDVVWPAAGSEDVPLGQAGLIELLIGALDDADTRLAEQCRRRLIELPRHLRGFDERLFATLASAQRPWAIRTQCADILLQREQAHRLRGALTAADLGTRVAALTALRRAPDFIDLVENPELQIEATVRAWLAREGDETRGDAIGLAIQMRLPGAMPLIRPLLVRGESAAADARAVSWRLVQAGTAVATFGDCASLPALAALARDDPDASVRLRSLQALHRTAFGPRAPCAGSFADEALRALLGRALADEASMVRMAALLVLETNAAWAAERLERLRAILADAAPGRGAERRLALQALAAGGASLPDELPRYFHDADPMVRRAAVTLVATRRPPGMASCLIGVLAREREAATGFQQALDGLRLMAGALVGFPESLHADNARNRVQVQRAMQTIFHGGSALGLDRARLVDGWLRWLCREAGLEASTEDVLKARAAFWVAAEANDEKAARAALEVLSASERSLLIYERGWLAR